MTMTRWVLGLTMVAASPALADCEAIVAPVPVLGAHPVLRVAHPHPVGSHRPRPRGAAGTLSAHAPKAVSCRRNLAPLVLALAVPGVEVADAAPAPVSEWVRPSLFAGARIGSGLSPIAFAAPGGLASAAASSPGGSLPAGRARLISSIWAPQAPTPDTANLGPTPVPEPAWGIGAVFATAILAVRIGRRGRRMAH